MGNNPLIALHGISPVFDMVVPNLVSQVGDRNNISMRPYDYLLVES